MVCGSSFADWAFGGGRDVAARARGLPQRYEMVRTLTAAVAAVSNL